MIDRYTDICSFYQFCFFVKSYYKFPTHTFGGYTTNLIIFLLVGTFQIKLVFFRQSSKFKYSNIFN